MKIKEWQLEERPREKLLQKGAEHLSDAELLAILIGSGKRGMNCVEWARGQLSAAGGLYAFFSLGPEKILDMPGLGHARTAQIIAVREIAARFCPG